MNEPSGSSQRAVVALPGYGHVPMTDDPDLVARILLVGSDTETS
jgi:pimeloyl-ACP methyl ester carboxylesterase